VTETTQTLGDGTHINRQETYTIYRDGEGRIRRESGEQVWISDPVANVSYVLNTKQQTPRKLSLSHTVSFNKMPAEAQTANAEISAAGPIWFEDSVMAGRAMAGGGTSKAEAGKRESLGKQEMEGVEVDGTRTTTVIPQGQIGNDRPLQIVHVSVACKATFSQRSLRKSIGAVVAHAAACCGELQLAIFG
jgi:hypothetical protein